MSFELACPSRSSRRASWSLSSSWWRCCCSPPELCCCWSLRWVCSVRCSVLECSSKSAAAAGLWVVVRELRDLLRGGGASPPSSDSPLEARLVTLVSLRFSSSSSSSPRTLTLALSGRDSPRLARQRTAPPSPLARSRSVRALSPAL